MNATAYIQQVRPDSRRWEAVLLLAATLVLLVGTLYFADRYGVEEKTVTILDWQVSAYSGLQGVDQAIYNDLLVAADEIYWINYFSGYWPSDEDFQAELLPPFYRDAGWERMGSVKWVLKDVVQEGEAQGLTLYHGSGGSIEGQGSYLLSIDHKHAGGLQVSSANIWWHPDPNTEVPATSTATSIILQGWKQVVPYRGRDEFERLNAG
ncbi:MAG TPA: hypothetical protein GX696_06505 [Pseudomonadaceae bacterium]|nr:hypothetical protein [Pseudomonadaceae bacterium]